MSDKNAEIAQAITDMAVRMRREADHLDRLAGRLLAENDLGYVNEAVSAVTGLAASLRLDVLISRLLRRLSGGAK